MTISGRGGPQDQFEAAAQVEATDPERAMATYLGVAVGAGPWASDALFAQGRLQAHLGHHDAARRPLEAYLARYPGGPNRADARALLRRIP